MPGHAKERRSKSPRVRCIIATALFLLFQYQSISIFSYETPSHHRAGPGNATNSSATPSNTSLLPRRNASVAVILAGDVRTLLCPSAREDYNDAILQPLRDANYTVHIFALIRPTVYYGSGSPWSLKFPKCIRFDTPFVNLSKSIVHPKLIHGAIANLSANTRELRVIEPAAAMASWNASLEQKTAHIGCDHQGVNWDSTNSSHRRFTSEGYARYAQWKIVHDGYAMMKEAEAREGMRFEYVLRLRPDNRPQMMDSIVLDSKVQLPLSDSDHCLPQEIVLSRERRAQIILVGENDTRASGTSKGRETTMVCHRTAITHRGDGQALMRRDSSDAYFSVYQIYASFCAAHLEYYGGRYVLDENPDHYFSDFVREKRGVPLVKHENFTFRFRRPIKCKRLCKEAIDFSR